MVKLLDNLLMRVQRRIGWQRGSLELTLTAENGVKLILQVPKQLKEIFKSIDEDKDRLIVTIERKE